MRTLKKGITGLFIFLNFYSLAQIGFGIKGGFQQSIPLVMRDSFSGKPTFSGAINFYFPKDSTFNFVTGLGYRGISLGHKTESSSLVWQTLALNLGAEWSNLKFKTKFYTGFNFNYVFDFGKTVLSGGTSSGSSYINLRTVHKIVPSLEAGLTFSPRPFINITIRTIQPVIQNTSYGKPTLPGSLSFGIEYRITTHDIKNWKNDTTPSSEKKFAKNIKAGTLYFIEDGTDSSHRIFRDSLAKYFTFSKVGFIKGSDFKSTLQDFQQAPDSNQIFIVKIGNIVYNTGRASTHGLIIYNYKMENPVPDKPFFVRNLSGDSFFEDPIIVRKMITKLNYRLYRMYSMF